MPNHRMTQQAAKILDELLLKRKYTPKRSTARWKPDITISRCPGSGGRLIAKRVSKKLSWDYCDKRIAATIAQEMGVSKKTLAKIDERGRTRIADLLHSLFNPEYISDYKYIQLLKRVMRRVGKNGDAVIVGRGGSQIIPHSKALHVRIVASEDVCIKRLAKYRRLTRKQARELYNRITQRRRTFLRQYFDTDIADARNYDLVINTDDISLNRATELIINAFKRKFPNHK